MSKQAAPESIRMNSKNGRDFWRRIRRGFRQRGRRRRGEHGLDEVRSFEHRGRNGGEGPGVAQERGGPSVWEADVGPILQPEIVGFKESARAGWRETLSARKRWARR